MPQHAVTLQVAGVEGGLRGIWCENTQLFRHKLLAHDCTVSMLAQHVRRLGDCCGHGAGNVPCA